MSRKDFLWFTSTTQRAFEETKCCGHIQRWVLL